MDNTVTVTGNATRLPELRYSQAGKAVASFGLAVNRRYQVGGEWAEEVSFFDVTAWADLAEHVAESVAKGDRVIVTGRLEQRSWETPEGDRRSKVEIVADDVGLSLRWASGTATKAERSAGGQERPAARPPSPPRRGGAKKPAAPAYDYGSEFDSEPF